MRRVNGRGLDGMNIEKRANGIFKAAWAIIVLNIVIGLTIAALVIGGIVWAIKSVIREAMKPPVKIEEVSKEAGALFAKVKQGWKEGVDAVESGSTNATTSTNAVVNP